MSTWDDKPNDYEHALQIIDRLRREIESWKIQAHLANQRSDKFWNELLALRSEQSKT